MNKKHSLAQKQNRLRIKELTLKALFAKSGNLCSFPGCSQNLISGSGIFAGEICHIEAVSQNGPRYNSSKTPEQLRSANNLVIMCNEHHKTIDTQDYYTVEVLKEIKLNHELKYENQGFQVNNELLSKICADINDYLFKIERLNTIEHDTPDIAMKIDITKTFFELIEEIRQLLAGIEDINNSLFSKEETLEEDLIQFLDSQGIDTSSLEHVPYYEKPYLLRNWETLCLAFPNHIRKLGLRIDQLELRYLNLYLSVYPNDLEAKKKLHILKTTIEDYARTICHVD